MFKKLVAIEPISLMPSAQQKLHDYAEEVIMFDNIKLLLKNHGLN
jgi:hypothetical protein